MRTDEEINALVVSRIKGVRERSGFTKKYAARAMGVSLAEYEAFESGKSAPTATQTIDFCQSFGVSFDYICGMRDNECLYNIDCGKLNYLGNIILHAVYKSLLNNKLFSKLY